MCLHEKINKNKLQQINTINTIKDNQTNTIQQVITYNDFLKLHQNINSMKTEIQDLKNMVNNLTTLLKAVYEFEEQ